MRLHQLALVVLLALCAVFCSPCVHAQQSGYSASVSVADTSDGQRDHAFSVALGQVLTQLDGRGVTAASGYTDALGQASSLVQKFSYHRAAQGSAQPFTLEVHFDDQAVRQLADRLNAQTRRASQAANPQLPAGGSSRLWVSNMGSALDLAHLLATLRADANVASVEPVAADGNGVLLAVKTRSGLSDVLGDLQASGRVQPDSTPHPSADASVSWLR